MDKDLTVSAFVKILANEVVTDDELQAAKDYIGCGYLIADITDTEKDMVRQSTVDDIRPIIDSVIMDNINFQFKLRFGI